MWLVPQNQPQNQGGTNRSYTAVGQQPWHWGPRVINYHKHIPPSTQLGKPQQQHPTTHRYIPTHDHRTPQTFVLCSAGGSTSQVTLHSPVMPASGRYVGSTVRISTPMPRSRFSLAAVNSSARMDAASRPSASCEDLIELVLGR